MMGGKRRTLIVQKMNRGPEADLILADLNGKPKDPHQDSCEEVSRGRVSGRGKESLEENKTSTGKGNRKKETRKERTGKRKVSLRLGH